MPLPRCAAFLCICLSGLFCGPASAQSNRGVDLNEGDRLRSKGDLAGAIRAYRKVYVYDPGFSGNIYNMATAFALLGQADSCFYYLYKANSILPSKDALEDPDLYPVMSDPRWQRFEEGLVQLIVRKNDTLYPDIDYARKLWRIRAADQAYYWSIAIAEKKSGKQSEAVKKLWTLKQSINERNQQDLEVLLKSEGWPKISEVGYHAASAAFLVIQHSDSALQSKYLPVIHQLCLEREASWQWYALMYDRLQTDREKPQKYGSQVRYNDTTKKYELFPLEDEARVDEWRREAGMGPLADYVKQWDIVFTPKSK
ncbi:MAG: hypothetical protein JNL13_03915 [Chitinophagaceae bacterium]|nr:hypothetical protein [Chitinophagaceae bacterium]